MKMLSLEEYEDRHAYPLKVVRKPISQQTLATGMAELAALEMKRHGMKPGGVPKSSKPNEMEAGIARRKAIMAFLTNNGPTTTAGIMEGTGIRYGALRNHLGMLTSSKHLTCKRRNGHEATYSVRVE